VEAMRESASDDISLAGGVFHDHAADFGLPDGRPVKYWFLAVYRTQHGSIVESDPIWVTAVPGIGDKAVQNLKLTWKDDMVVAIFTPPQDGEVHLYESANVPTVQAGTTLTESDLAALGRPIDTQRNSASWRPSVPGLIFVIPVTKLGSAFVCGTAAPMLMVQPVGDLTISQPDWRGNARVTFKWPGNAHEVRIRVTNNKTNEPPRGKLPSAERTKDLGWADIVCPPGAPMVDVTAIAVVNANGSVFESEPRVKTIPYTSRRTIYYRIIPQTPSGPKRTRNDWSKAFGNVERTEPIISVKLKAVAEPPIKQWPELGLYYVPLDRRPLRKSDGIWLANFGGNDCTGTRLNGEIALEDPCESAQFRLFPVDETQMLGWQLIDITD